MATKIEWVQNPDGTKGETWNVVTGCTKVSAGCRLCYAERMAKRLRGRHGYPADDPFRVTLHHDRLERPLKWKKPRMVFVCSMSDLFHEEVDDHFRRHVFATMDYTPQHTYQILTKRPAFMRDWIRGYCGEQQFAELFPHVWLGVTAENQDTANERIPILLQTPASVRFVSVEPMLGPVNLGMMGTVPESHPYAPVHDRINWVICGCESGPGRRPMQLEWAIDLVRQCKAAGVPVFVKQIEVNGKVSRDPDEWPEELRVREFPV